MDVYDPRFITPYPTFASDTEVSIAHSVGTFLGSKDCAFSGMEVLYRSTTDYPCGDDICARPGQGSEVRFGLCLDLAAHARARSSHRIGPAHAKRTAVLVPAVDGRAGRCI